MEILETTHSTRTVRASTVKSWRAWRDVKEEGAGPVPLEESGPQNPSVGQLQSYFWFR